MIVLSTGAQNQTPFSVARSLDNNLSGEKIVPLQQEEHITVNPMVMGALMFGRERAQPGLIVEPYPQYAIDPDDADALAEFRNKIW